MAEQTASDAERIGYYRRMQAAVEELLILNGVVTREDVDAEAAAMAARSYRDGARVVARAWVDDAYRGRLIARPTEACAELGLDIRPMHLIVVENTPQIHNVIVCTLCSCYPRMLLGLPPQWYKSREYRSRVVVEPRNVLAEFGTVLPGDTQIRVHDSSADMRYMVLPMRPDDADELPEPALARRVTRDALIGTAVIDR